MAIIISMRGSCVTVICDERGELNKSKNAKNDSRVLVFCEYGNIFTFKCII